MKHIALLIIGCVAAFAGESALQRMQNEKLSIAQRNDACFELRGTRTPEAISVFRQALGTDMLRACGAANLRAAEAVDALKDAMTADKSETRAVAAASLGELQLASVLPDLVKLAHDPDMLVATNAVQGLTYYQDRAVLPYLLDLAKDGGVVGVLALSRAAQFPDSGALAIARKLISGGDIPAKLTAIRVIGEQGDSADLAALGKVAAQNQEVSASGRGFGLMPAINIGQAARAAIEKIKSRSVPG